MYHQFHTHGVGHPLTRHFLIVLLGLVLTVGFATPAFAASGPSSVTQRQPVAHKHLSPGMATVTCGGNGCNGLDPYQSGCAQSFYVATSVEVYPILVELEYSTICRTNWTQAYWLDGSMLTGWGASIERFSGPNGPDWHQVYWTPTGQAWINTNQVYAPVNQSQACLYFDPEDPLNICTDKRFG